MTENPQTPTSGEPTPAPENPQQTAAPSQNEEALQAEKQRYMYLYAEFENYKKRAIRERSEAVKFGFESAARDLLQVADNLQRAVEHMPESTDKNLRLGIQMVLDQLISTFQRHGVEAVKTLDQPFDPNLHEAVGQEPSASPAGSIVREHQRGYTLHGRLLRPARVVLSAGNA